MNDSGIIFDEVINADADKKTKSNDEAKSIDEAKWNGKETIFNEKTANCETQIIYLLLAFWLITLALLIAVFTVIWFDKISNKTKTFIDTSLCKLQMKNINQKWVINSKI